MERLNIALVAHDALQSWEYVNTEFLPNADDMWATFDV